MQPNWLLQRSYLTHERIGLRFGQQSWTFKQLYERAEQVARQLVAYDLKAGDRVAILAASTPNLIHVIYCCMHAQSEFVFLNTRLSSYELDYQIKDAEVSLVLVDEQHFQRVENHRVLSFNALFESKGMNYTFATEWSEQQTISIMYTSGTTGFPKGVRQTVQNHSASAISSALNLGLTDKDIWLCCVPIFHISGFSILMRSLLYGMEVRLYEKFDAKKCAVEMAQGEVTKISAVATMLEQMLTYMEQHDLKAHQNFKTALIGGGPVPVRYLERAMQLNISVSQTYGMTETASQTATLSNEDAMKKLGSAGKPLFFNQIRIKNVTGPCEEGEICIRGPHVTPGYIGRFKDRAVTEDGWLMTGDIGYLDEEGYLYVIDRRADLIISGGENIYPAEIENVLMAHPAIKEAGVCSQEHEKWGQVPIAFVVTKDKITESQIITYCQERLAAYKVPHEIYFVEELPRNDAKKLMRRILRTLL